MLDYDFDLKRYFNYKNLVGAMILIFIAGCVFLGFGLKYQKDNKALVRNCTRKVEAECISINETVWGLIKMKQNGELNLRSL